MVPAMATAWQQRAPGAAAINNQPAAAAVRPPAALPCKCAALTVWSAPPAPADAPVTHRPFLLANERHDAILSWQQQPPPKAEKQIIRTLVQNLRIVSGFCPRKLPGQIWPRFPQARPPCVWHRVTESQRSRHPPCLLPGGSTVVWAHATWGVRSPAAGQGRWGGPPTARTCLASFLPHKCGQ